MVSTGVSLHEIHFKAFNPQVRTTLEFLYDAKQLLKNIHIVEAAPYQLYCSALIFSSRETIMSKGVWWGTIQENTYTTTSRKFLECGTTDYWVPFWLGWVSGLLTRWPNCCFKLPTNSGMSYQERRTLEGQIQSHSTPRWAEDHPWPWIWIGLMSIWPIIINLDEPKLYTTLLTANNHKMIPQP